MIPEEWLKHAPGPGALKAGKQWTVFLSYRSINRPWVLNLYDVLVQVGHKVFLDQYVLIPGSELITQLQDGLDKSQAGILIWSSDTKDSKWVQKEYNTLETKATEDPDFYFVPVKIDSKVELPAFARNRVYIDFSNYPDGPTGGELIRLLHGIIGKPLSPEAVVFAAQQDEASSEAILEIRAAIKNGDANRLMQLASEGGLPWQTSPALAATAAEGLIRLKRNDEALQLLDIVVKRFPKAIRPKQLQSLALARRGKEGDLPLAQTILGKLHAANNLDPETLGIYARTWMDRYEVSKNVQDLIQSRDLYADAFEKSPDDYYTGINAAAKSIFIGTQPEIEKGMAYASRVQELVGTKAIEKDYWKTATVAEVFLLQRKYDEASVMYATAIGFARTEIANIESTKKQATRLLDKLSPTQQERDKVLSVFP
jgi:tetratricopeptide (TPR) repeat protein